MFDSAMIDVTGVATYDWCGQVSLVLCFMFDPAMIDVTGVPHMTGVPKYL